MLTPYAKAVFYGHLKQEDLGMDLGSLPVSSEKLMFYGQPKQEDNVRIVSTGQRVETIGPSA